MSAAYTTARLFLAVVWEVLIVLRLKQEKDMEYNVERFATFSDAYRKGLAKAMKEHPHEYLPGLTAEEVADKMLSKINTKGIEAVTIAQSGGFKNACKQLGIKKVTYKQINKFLKAE